MPRSSAEVQEIFSSSQGDDRGAAARHRDRGVEREVVPLGVLLERLALQDQIHELPGRSVHDRRLGGVHLDQDVVDPAAVQGAQHVLHGVDLGVPDLDRGGPHQVGHVRDQGPHFRGAVQVDPPEDHAVAHRGGFHRQGHRIAGVQSAALDGDLARESALFHRWMAPAVSPAWVVQRKRDSPGAGAQRPNLTHPLSGSAGEVLRAGGTRPPASAAATDGARWPADCRIDPWGC